jgi:hypothetical protein
MSGVDTVLTTTFRGLTWPVHGNVSGQTGLHIFDVVTGWLDSSFSGRRVEHRATMTDGDRVLVWYAQYGTHIGNGFPRMAGLCAALRTAPAWGGTAGKVPPTRSLTVVGIASTLAMRVSDE